MTQLVNLSMTPGGRRAAIVHVSQYDTSRVVSLQLDDNSMSGTCTIQGTRPDGAGIEQAATYNSTSQVITWKPNADYTEISGDVICEAVFSEGGDRIGSMNFLLRVEPAGKAADAPAPGGTITIKKNGIHNVREYANADVNVPTESTGVDWCVTPEDYGAAGDGKTDDTAAFTAAVASGKTVVCAGTYLIDGISAQDVDILLTQKAKIVRKTGGNDPFINVNPDRQSGGYITKRSYIRGGTIDASEAQIAIAVNGAEQFTLENIEIGQCHTGLYLGYQGNSVPKYNIESRIDKVKFVNKLNLVADPSAYTDSVAVYDAGTDSQFANIIMENFHTGMHVGGNAEINNVHHWISNEAIYDGSVTFRVDENIAGFFTDCCSDSVETAFSVATYSRCMVKGFSQVRNGLMTDKKNMYYLVADTDAEKTLWFFSYGSAHRGHPSVGVVFYEVSDNIYSRRQSQGAQYDSHVVIDGAAISNMASRNNTIPYGYQALGQLKNFMGTSDAYLYSFNFNDVMENGTYSVQMQTSSNGPDGITTGASSLIVSGYDSGKMQFLVNNTEGIFYRFYNGSWQPWRELADIMANKIPSVGNFSGEPQYTWLTDCDLNTITKPGMYGIQTSTAVNKPSAVTSGTLTLWVGGTCDETTPIMALVQVALTKDAMYVRARKQDTDGWTWTSWAQIGAPTDFGVLKNFNGTQSNFKDTDLNDLTEPGMFAFNPSSSAVLNKPSGLTGTKANVWVGGSPNSKSQLILNEGGLFLRFYAANTGTWTEWTKMSA